MSSDDRLTNCIVMADGKNKIIVYRDWKTTFDKLTDEEAGRLIKHFFNYVNDENPVPVDRLTEIIFEPIKQTLKRDLKNWEETKGGKSSGGQLGNLKRWHEDLYNQVVGGQMNIDEAVNIAQHRKASHTDKKPSHGIGGVAVSVSVSDSVTDSDREKDNHTKKSKVKSVEEKAELFKQRKLNFAATLEPHVSVYGREMILEFYRYWTEPNKSGTQFRQELEKTWDVERRLGTWAKREKITPNGTTKKNPQPNADDRRNDLVEREIAYRRGTSNSSGDRDIEDGSYTDVSDESNNEGTCNIFGGFGS